MPKRLLIIEAASDVCASEIKHIKIIAEMLGIDHCTIRLHEMTTFREQLCEGGSYDYVYLAAHANTEFFGESDASVAIAWTELAMAFCSSDCLNAGAILLLGCCRGGLKRVAYSLFCTCTKIDYVCGPRWTVTGPDISTGFHVFIYNMEIRREQPSTAIDRASAATHYDFFCHDRIELEDELGQVCEAEEDI